MDQITLNDYFKAGSVTNMDEEIFILARSRSTAVRRHVAENPKTPTAVLILLSYDEDADVRIAAGMNPTTPRFAVKRLILDDNVDVRYAMAETSSLPVAFLGELTTDENPYVALRANRTIDNLRRSKLKSPPSKKTAAEPVYALGA